jgi:hypothetical protein
MKNKKIGKDGTGKDFTTSEAEMKEPTLEDLHNDPKFPIESLASSPANKSSLISKL